MKAYLVEKGVPEKQILEEASSTSTEENFCFAREILEQHGLSQDEPVAYVTNAFHCYRAANTLPPQVHKCERHPRLYRLFFRTPLLYA